MRGHGHNQWHLVIGLVLICCLVVVGCSDAADESSSDTDSGPAGTASPPATAPEVLDLGPESGALVVGPDVFDLEFVYCDYDDEEDQGVLEGRVGPPRDWYDFEGQGMGPDGERVVAEFQWGSSGSGHFVVEEASGSPSPVEEPLREHWPDEWYARADGDERLFATEDVRQPNLMGRLVFGTYVTNDEVTSYDPSATYQGTLYANCSLDAVTVPVDAR
ncbi:MAG: hypothetical protein GY788_01395 [bacterium]|nr:hypothetical protein [bacterium]